jgi:hypothetical protein
MFHLHALIIPIQSRMKFCNLDSECWISAWIMELFEDKANMGWLRPRLKSEQNRGQIRPLELYSPHVIVFALKIVRNFELRSLSSSYHYQERNKFITLKVSMMDGWMDMPPLPTYLHVMGMASCLASTRTNIKLGLARRGRS